MEETPDPSFQSPGFYIHSTLLLTREENYLEKFLNPFQK